MSRSSPMPTWFHNFPRNSVDYMGGIVLFDVDERVFFRLEWGIGDNLLREDRAAGYDDYVNYEAWKLDSGPVAAAFRLAAEYGGDFEAIDGDSKDLGVCVSQIDGGMMLVKRKDKKTGDIREYVLDAIEMMFDSRPTGENMLYVCDTK